MVKIVNRRKWRQFLIIIILCLLIFYIGSNCKIAVPDYVQMRINKYLLEKSEETYLSGFSFVREGESWSFQEWIEKEAMNLIPFGTFVQGKSDLEMETEDEETYEMILAQQANDENSIDEKGNLIVTDKEKKSSEASKTNLDISMDKLKNYEYLIQNFYTVDGSTSVNKKLFNAEQMLEKDMQISKDSEGPKILIYHTHSQEAFKDSKKGDRSTTIMGMGEYLAELLNETYEIKTIHHEGIYDLIDGKLDRSKAYQFAETEITKVLEKNPTIEVVIDLHRDGVGNDTHLVTEIDGKKTAQIMFFNGLSRTKANGDIAYLKNPYIEENLAFSFQMQLKALELYPGLTRHIYLKSYRYNMHLKPKTLLVEAGAQTNTVSEMRNAMKALAKILDSVVDP